MMKLTLTLVLGSATLSNGFGVARGSGGSEASQLVPAEARSSAENFESRNAETQIWCSRAASVGELGPEKTRNSDFLAEARQLAEARASRNAHNLLAIMRIFRKIVPRDTPFQAEPGALKRNPHASLDFGYVIDETPLTSRLEIDLKGHVENHCSF
jgi:hypothetical protein